MALEGLVLVTGASGYIATQVVKLLQEEGYRVRGTVRSLKDEKKVKHLYDLVPNAKHKLELVEADLLNPDTWPAALDGVTYVMHLASPFPLGSPKDENLIIKPAVDGTNNVFKAIADQGNIKRVVLTSSTIAVAAKGGNKTPYTENDWADPKDPAAQAYNKSKILAEKAAWDFLKELPHGKKFELAVVNPTMVVGPALHANPGASTAFVGNLLERATPAVPAFHLPCVDVRDVALAHLRCLTLDEAVGHRHIMVTANINMRDLARLLDKEFRPQGYNVPTMGMPGPLVTVASWFDAEVKSAKLFASEPLMLDNSRMRNVLGITPIPLEKSFIDMAYSLIDNGFVKKTKQYKGRPAESS